MAYATLQDLIDRYGASEITSLADRSGSGDPDQATVAGKAIGDASELIDGYIGGRYQLPLSPVPGNILRACCDIARFYLWRDQASEAVMALYKAALKLLADIQSGAVTLQSAAVDAAQTSDAAEIVSAPRLFSADSLRGL